MRVAIIGGYGKMGRWLAAFLTQEGHDVVIAGRNQARLKEAARQLGVEQADAGQAVSGSGAVIISVPVDSVEAAAEEITQFTRDGQYIFDVTSVKTGPVEAMHRHVRKGTVLGTHPMFGPGAPGIKGQRFVLTPVGKEEEALAGKVRGYLEKRGAKVAVMTPQEHDEIMSIVLGLSHFIALASADALAALGKIREAQAVSGTTFHLLLRMAEAVLSEDPVFYSALQLNLPGAVRAETLFIDKAAEWAALVKDGRRRGFMDRMKSLRETFEKEDPGFKSAYGDMYRLIE
jgi:prephenate dehydrogenase